MFHYRAYEILLESVLPCPELLPSMQDVSSPDAIVRLGNVAPNLNNPTVSNPFYQVSPYKFLLKVDGTANYLVKGGREIVINPHPDAQPEKVRLFLLGSAMGALLYQRGHVTHGRNADRIDELIDRLESEWHRHNSINSKRRNGSASI